MREISNFVSPESIKELPAFPITEYDQIFDSFQKRPNLIDDTIVHCRYEFGPKDSRHAFYLRSPIGSHRFILRLVASGHGEHSYSLQSEIEGYGFAIANLDEDDREELFKVRASFIESVSVYTDEMQTIESSTHENPYTIEDIKGCITKILQHPDNRQTTDELRNLAATYVINQIFEQYQELFGESYFGNTPPESKAIARKRLFVAKFKKYLKTWEVIDVPLSTIYQLKRKAKL
jgi:hypothetical protein